MTRRNSFEVVENILDILKKRKELSVKAVSEELGAQWETTIKSLEFLLRIGLVKESQGKKTNKFERLFSLK